MEHPFVFDPAPYDMLIELAAQEVPVALATVIAAEGSTPQVPGASALFSGTGLVAGTVGGGSVEGRVEKAAVRALGQGDPVLRTFDLGETVFEEADGICGGRLKILIDPHPERAVAVFRKAREAARKRRRGIQAVWIVKSSGSSVRNVSRTWLPGNFRDAALRSMPFRDFGEEIREALNQGNPSVIACASGWLYCEPHIPPPRLVIAGAGHVGREVARLGKRLQFEVTVIDDRPEFANRDRFPDADHIVVADVGEALRIVSLSPETYIVIVTRGHRDDAKALRTCIRSRAAYIGMIGSRRKIGMVRARFLARGWAGEADWARVRTPIGLPIGSRTVTEIAVSIAAELVAARRGTLISGQIAFRFQDAQDHGDAPRLRARARAFPKGRT